jgi:hypothetical protein
VCLPNRQSRIQHIRRVRPRFSLVVLDVHLATSKPVAALGAKLLRAWAKLLRACVYAHAVRYGCATRLAARIGVVSVTPVTVRSLAPNVGGRGTRAGGATEARDQRDGHRGEEPEQGEEEAGQADREQRRDVEEFAGERDEKRQYLDSEQPML